MFILHTFFEKNRFFFWDYMQTVQYISIFLWSVSQDENYENPMFFNTSFLDIKRFTRFIQKPPVFITFLKNDNIRQVLIFAKVLGGSKSPTKHNGLE